MAIYGNENLRNRIICFRNIKLTLKKFAKVAKFLQMWSECLNGLFISLKWTFRPFSLSTEVDDSLA